MEYPSASLEEKSIKMRTTSPAFNGLGRAPLLQLIDINIELPTDIYPAGVEVTVHLDLSKNVGYLALL
jgi:hypothetical protein